jgi:3',5'-cyclic AMP phosphodiesterase CpdA
LIEGLHDDLGYFGESIASADINSDGFDDAIIGSKRAWTPYSNTIGLVYVIYGKPTGLTNIDIINFNSGDGFVIYGVPIGGCTG